MTRLDLKVSPGASREAVTGWLGTTLKVSVTAAPERGRANAAVEALLARTLGLPPSQVRVVAGQAARSKRVTIDGLDAAEVRRRLDAELA